MNDVVKPQAYIQATILVVEADKNLREKIGRKLHDEGYRVITAAERRSALHLATTEAPDLVILASDLPNISGAEVCRTLRKHSIVPIVALLNERADELDKVLMLELGADIYLVKPFSWRELMARLHSLTRRMNMPMLPYAEVESTQKLPKELTVVIPPAPAAASRTGVGLLTFVEVEPESADLKVEMNFDQLIVGCLQIHFPARRIFYKGQLVPMPPKQFDLLAFLAQHPMRVFAREELLNQVWGYDSYSASRSHTLAVHIYSLRLKLEQDPSNPKLIQTIFGTGYLFNNDEVLKSVA